MAQQSVSFGYVCPCTSLPTNTPDNSEMRCTFEQLHDPHTYAEGHDGTQCNCPGHSTYHCAITHKYVSTTRPNETTSSFLPMGIEDRILVVT